MKYTIILLVATATFSSLFGQPVEVIPPQEKILSSEGGRFVFGQISSARKDQYMLDTKTGRLWQIVVDKEDRIKLQPVQYMQILGDESPIPESEEEINTIRSVIRQNTLETLQQQNQKEKNE